APGVVLYLSGLDELRSLGWLATLVFSIACALRLARFNVMIEDPSLPDWRKNFFVGMPAPAGAIVGLLPVYLRFLISPDAPPHGFVVLEIVYVLAIALLMASRVPHFSGKSIGRVRHDYVAVVLIGLAAALLLIVNFPLQSLVALSLAYLGTIPFSVRHFQALQKENH
ncbi:MAG: CDP-diacylglycerol--serine O-phosphatidyltransferase, partial [Hyphomicrobiales bacterium]|nr:CDP-diacylglycerol--serine O-phosphatidyltransferase [Hyphomicrobiales bacterium]